MLAQITLRTNSAVHFEAYAPFEPTKEQLSEAQALLGYHPVGYGDPSGIHKEKLADGRWLAKWTCWGSCD